MESTPKNTNIELRKISSEDIRRMSSWISDPEVNSSWYGLDDDGDPLHIGYSPTKILYSDQEQIDMHFAQLDRNVFSIYTNKEGHIGEVQIDVEPSLKEAQVFIIIGRKDLWYHHLGTMALLTTLELVFVSYGLHRAWVDVPDYNFHALHIFESIGFTIEGHLRATHLKHGEWYDSKIMGMLSEEYSTLRNNLHNYLPLDQDLETSNPPVKS